MLEVHGSIMLEPRDLRHANRRRAIAPMDDPTKDLEAALRGLDYPAPRNKLVAKAVENGASPATLARILELPETADFLNAEALRRALGVTVQGEQPHGWE